MSIDMINEPPSLGSSPRISFSHDHIQTSENTLFQDGLNLNSSSNLDTNSEFDFCIFPNTDVETCTSADELFSDGIILPIQIQDKFILDSKHVGPVQPKPPMFPPPSPATARIPPEKSPAKPLLRIGRSSSVRGQEGGGKKGAFWSSLSRSNSTGSVPSPRPSLKEGGQKQQSGVGKHGLKPPLRKSYGQGHFGNYGARISPIINVPSPSICKGSGNLFGLGSFFKNGKDKKSKS